MIAWLKSESTINYGLPGDCNITPRRFWTGYLVILLFDWILSHAS